MYSRIHWRSMLDELRSSLLPLRAVWMTTKAISNVRFAVNALATKHQRARSRTTLQDYSYNKKNFLFF